MPTSETAGLLSAWKENAQVSLGAENVLLGTDDENLPLSLYEIMSAQAGTQQRAKTGSNSFTILFIELQSRRFDPLRNRNCPDVAALPDQVNNGPVIFPLLKMIDAQVDKFRPAQSATEQDRQHCAVALPPN